MQWLTQHQGCAFFSFIFSFKEKTRACTMRLILIQKWNYRFSLKIDIIFFFHIIKITLRILSACTLNARLKTYFEYFLWMPLQVPLLMKDFSIISLANIINIIVINVLFITILFIVIISYWCQFSKHTLSYFKSHHRIIVDSHIDKTLRYWILVIIIWHWLSLQHNDWGKLSTII